MPVPAHVATFSPRAREALHRLLHRDVRRCSSTALANMVRTGCASGAAGGHELTTLGRRCAELSELIPSEGWIEIDASFEPWRVRRIEVPQRQRSFGAKMAGRTPRHPW